MAGEVDVLVKGHAIGFTWHEGDERDTSVLLTLRSYGDETGITITETGFDGLPNPAEKAAAALSDWEGLLGELSSTVEQAVADGFVVEEIVVVEEPTADEGESVEAESEEAEVSEDAAEEAEAEVSEETELPDDLDDTVVVEAIVRPEEVKEPAEPEQVEPEQAETDPEPKFELVEDPPAEKNAEAEEPGAPEVEIVEAEVLEAEIVRDPEPQPENGGEVPLVLPGPPEEDDASTGDPDFDELLRGN